MNKFQYINELQNGTSDAKRNYYQIFPEEGMIMMDGIPAELRSFLMVWMTLAFFLAFPGSSHRFWHCLKGLWLSHLSRNTARRKRAAEAKLKKYCRIDLRKFR